MDYSTDTIASGNSGRQVGSFLNTLIGGASPMGSWTGLPPLVGAPLSGALLGAGLGGLVGAGQSALNWVRGEPQEKRPWWKRPWALGLGGGAALGLASGITQTMDPGFLERRFRAAERVSDQLNKASSSKQASTPDDVIRVLLSDPYLSPFDRSRLVLAVQNANSAQMRQLMIAAASGTLTAMLARNILGLGVLGSSALGGIAALLTNNILPGKTRYV